MPKPFTKEELLLLDQPPRDLDPIKKKMRERLKARQYMEKSRSKQRTEMGDDSYKAMRLEKMTKYRKEKQTEYLQAVEKTTSNPKEKAIITKSIKVIEKKQTKPTRELSDRIKVPTNKKIIDPPKVIKQSTNNTKIVVPDWKRYLLLEHPNYKVNSNEYMQRAGFKQPTIDNHYTIFENVMRAVFKFEIPQNLKAVIIFILRGNNIEHPSMKNKQLDRNNINIFKNYLDKYFNRNKVHKTLNDIIEYYYRNSRTGDGSATVKTYTRVFTNILSRIDSYADSYQVFTNYGIELNTEYTDKAKDNKVSSKDKNKLIIMRDNYDIDAVENNKKLIEENGLNSEEKALASIYLLQAPRRNETASLKLTQKGITADERALMNQNANYIVMDGKEPVLQLYGQYKTASKTIGKIKKKVMGFQDLKILPEVAKYLKQHIEENKLKLGDYLFGSHNYTTINQNMTARINDVMFKIFKIQGIGSRIIRQGASMFNQQNNRSQNQREDMAEQMAHSESVQKSIYNKINLDDVEDEEEEDKRKAQVKKGNKIPIKKQEATDVKTKPKVILKPVEKVGNVRRSSRKKKK